MLTKITVAVAVLGFTLASAHAADRAFTSEQWRHLCGTMGTGIDPRVPHARCEARLAGEIDGIITGMTLTHGAKWFCILPHVSADVRRQVVEAYLDHHPEALSAPFGEGVAAALADAYPCHGRR